MDECQQKGIGEFLEERQLRDRKIIIGNYVLSGDKA